MALNCKITKGLEALCQTNVSGVLRMAIANWDSTYTFTASSGDCIDSIDLGTEKVYNLAFVDGTGVASSTGTIGTGTKYHMHSVSGTLGALDCSMFGDDYNNFFLSRVIIFVETKNHSVYAFGVDNGLVAETFEFTTGTAEGDANGINFTYSGAQKNAPVPVKDWTVVEGLMAP